MKFILKMLVKIQNVGKNVFLNIIFCSKIHFNGQIKVTIMFQICCLFIQIINRMGKHG